MFYKSEKAMSTATALTIRAVWDDEAKVYVAESDDVPGLITEADTVSALVQKLKYLIPELLDENGYSDGDEIPFTVKSEIEAVTYRHAA
jgi:predicted RNase H-like HicB family nuclease